MKMSLEIKSPQLVSYGTRDITISVIMLNMYNKFQVIYLTRPMIRHTKD